MAVNPFGESENKINIIHFVQCSRSCLEGTRPLFPSSCFGCVNWLKSEN